MEALELPELISVPLLDRVILERGEVPEGAGPFTARTGLVRMPSRLTIASARELSRMVGPDIRGHRTVMMDFSRTLYIDDTAAMVIRELVNIALTERRECVIVGRTARRRRPDANAAAGTAVIPAPAGIHQIPIGKILSILSINVKDGSRRPAYNTPQSVAPPQSNARKIARPQPEPQLRRGSYANHH